MFDAKAEENRAKVGQRRGGLADLLMFAQHSGAAVHDHTKASSN